MSDRDLQALLKEVKADFSLEQLRKLIGVAARYGKTVFYAGDEAICSGVFLGPPDERSSSFWPIRRSSSFWPIRPGNTFWVGGTLTGDNILSRLVPSRLEIVSLEEDRFQLLVTALAINSGLFDYKRKWDSETKLAWNNEQLRLWTRLFQIVDETMVILCRRWAFDSDRQHDAAIDGVALSVEFFDDMSSIVFAYPGGGGATYFANELSRVIVASE